MGPGAPTQPGSPQGTIIVSGNDGERADVSVEGIAQGPSLSVPLPLDFGTVPVKHQKTMTLSFQDLGLGLLTGTVDTSKLKSPFAAVSGGGKFKITDGTSHAVKIKFVPRATGPFGGTVTINSNDPSNPNVTVGIQGSGQ